MKKVVASLLMLGFAFLLQVAASAESADKIINRYKKAAGAEAAKRVKSTFMSGSLRAAEAAAGSFTIRASTPDRIRIDMQTAGSRVSECYNGKSAWRQDGRGLRTLLGGQAKLLRLRALLLNTRLADLSRHRVMTQVAGKATVEGREANAVEFVKGDARTKLFFDAASNLPVKQEYETAEGPEELFYGDYRAVDGVMEPFSIKIKDSVKEILIIIDQVQHNHGVDEKAFHYPQSDGGAPLPELEPLMKTIVANQEKIEELRERYTFREAVTEHKLDGSGRVKETETRVYDVTPVAGRFVERLIRVGDKALTPAEQEKEDRRVQKEVEDLLKEREKRERDKEKKQQRAHDKDEQDDPGDSRTITVLTFLRLSTITSMRRETFRGHEVIAFDFEPRKGVKTKNRLESLVSKLAGTMWLDENARQIARVEARLIDSFKFAGGLLASVSPSTAVVLEQDKIDNEVWLPSYAEANISAKVFFFAKFNRNVITRYSDYKKSQIDSKYELIKPADSKPRQ